MLTVHDYPTARTMEEGGIDVTLVGESLAQVALGYPSMTSLTLEETEHHGTPRTRRQTRLQCPSPGRWHSVRFFWCHHSCFR
jgi:ketopantoate hydroxymethyltransferase